MRLWYAAALLCLLCGEPAAGRVLHVPSQISSIQDAITGAVSGDTVLVDHGVYYEHLNYYGKAIVVASRVLVDGDTSHVSATVIDGSHPGKGDTESVVIFCHGESAAAQLCGFTLRNGSGTPVTTSEWGSFNAGNEVLVANGAPTLRECVMGDAFVIPQAGSAEVTASACRITNIMSQQEGRAVLQECAVANVDIRDGGNVEVNQSTIGSADIETGGDGLCQGSTVTSDIYCFYAVATADKCTVGSGTLAGDGALGLSNTLVRGNVEAESYNGSVTVSNCTVLGGLNLQEKCVGTGVIYSSIVLARIRQAVGTLTVRNTVVGSKDGLPATTCARPLDTENVFVGDPLFCAQMAGTYAISDASPAAPENNLSGQLIGAFGVGCSCCLGKRGNLDNLTVIDLSDLSELISYLTVTPTPQLPCPTSADISGEGKIDLTDLSILIGYLTGQMKATSLPSCPAYLAGR